MTDEKKAKLIRKAVMLVIFGGAIGLGYFLKMPVWDFSKDKEEEVADAEAEQLIRDEMNAENRLTILNSMVDGNPDSEKLKELLEQLKKDKYGDQVEPVDLDIQKCKNLADEHAVDLEEFAGQLDFYADGQKLGTLKGVTDPVVVEQTIDRYLAGLVKRYGPNWLPNVEGMTRRNTATQAVAQPKPKPSGVPGMERVGGGVPGMTRAKPGQSNLRIEPADQPKK
ncbi:hypothetical protein [Haloferula sp.]|uniref:hypothetical protein n=1 Tax=Haloferula sp. TaxID=2497595 RepID=UPI00329FFA82